VIHHTRGVYPNGDFKDNGVPSENLAEHINYNVLFRPGRALFLDGFCIYRGMGVSSDLIEEHQKTDNHRSMERDTRPYV
jgi:hypothetical protein